MLFFLFALVLLSPISGAELSLAEWSTTAVLFPLNTTLLAVLCAGGMILFASRAAVILYLIIECGLLAVGMAYPPISPFSPALLGYGAGCGEQLRSFGGTQFDSVDSAEPWHRVLARPA